MVILHIKPLVLLPVFIVDSLVYISVVFRPCYVLVINRYLLPLMPEGEGVKKHAPGDEPAWIGLVIAFQVFVGFSNFLLR